MDKEKIRLYKTLKPYSTAFIVGSIICAVLMALVFYGLINVIYYSFAVEREIVYMIFSSAFAAMIAAVIIYTVRLTKNERMAAAKRRHLREELSPQELLELEQEIRQSPYMFKTFYFLKNYFYIPQARILLKYVDISEVHNTIHSTNFIKDGVRVEIFSADGIRFLAYVRMWRDYMNQQQLFMNDLNARKRAQAQTEI